MRLRAVLEGTAVRTAALTVWADLPVAIERIGAAGKQPRVRVTVLAPRRAGVRHRRVVFYLAAAMDTAWQRVASRRWTRRGRLRLTAGAAFPAGRLGDTDRVLVCTREPKPNAFGEPVASDRVCGARRLPRSSSPAP